MPVSRMLISLPILVLPLAGMSVNPAHAASPSEEAVRYLARAQQTDSKCHFLSSPQRNELARYAARAQLAAASQMSSGAARNAASRGAAEGRAQPCTAATKSDVVDTLVAARTAVAAADRGQNTPTTAAPASNASIALASGPRGGLKFYSGQVKAYYIERKCKHLSASQDRRYWQAIGDLHRETVARNGSASVAPVMRNAEASANSLSCGAATEAAVEQGYETVAGD
ncbi:hypothetical protein [Aestuariivirga sp.]|uniref:hypothetical protein n=1 Tax=Aestuariivirga sp. TaxID=2650926 RepID=UPI0039E5070D